MTFTPVAVQMRNERPMTRSQWDILLAVLTRWQTPHYVVASTAMTVMPAAITARNLTDHKLDQPMLATLLPGMTIIAIIISGIASSSHQIMALALILMVAGIILKASGDQNDTAGQADTGTFYAHIVTWGTMSVVLTIWTTADAFRQLSSRRRGRRHEPTANNQ